MATWQEIGRSNFEAGGNLYDSGHYRSAASRFYYAVFSLVTGKLVQRNAAADFTGGARDAWARTTAGPCGDVLRPI